MSINFRNIQQRILKGDVRIHNVIINIMMSGIMKAATLACSFVMVPITIDYLNTENYGIWMAMTSILYWFAFFDVGLANGMRNYLSEALSLGDYVKARSYFSTAIFLLSGIAMMIGCASVPVVYLCDFKSLFNTQSIDSSFLANVLAIAIIFSLIQFVVKTIGVVYIAMQKYAINDFITFLGNLTSVIAIFILTKTTEGNLLYVVLAFTGLPVLIFTLASIPLLKQYPQLMPSLKSIDIETAKKVITKGLGFFIIQITSCLVIFGSANMFISYFCGPEQVTVYNVSYKLFNILVIGYTILISPLWNAYTDAAAQDDYNWIRKIFKKSLKLWAISVLVGLLLLALSGWFLHLWIGDRVHVPFILSACILLYVCMFNFANCTAYLLNGMNKIRVEMIVSVVASILYLLTFGIWGDKLDVKYIVLAMALSYGVMGIIYLYQSKLIINRKAKGIWNL